MKGLRGVKVKRKGWIGGEVGVNTDEYVIDQGVAEEMEAVKEHRVVDHRPGEWANGGVPVDGCENRRGFLRIFFEEASGGIEGRWAGLPGLSGPFAQREGEMVRLAPLRSLREISLHLEEGTGKWGTNRADCESQNPLANGRKGQRTTRPSEVFFPRQDFRSRSAHPLH